MIIKEVEASYPLSSMQLGMLLHSLHENGAYIQQLICDFHEDVDPLALLEAWQHVLQRHDVLRTAFRWQGIPEPIQEVYKLVELPWRNEDWRHLPADQQTQQFEHFLITDRQRAFDVTKPPLMRLAIFKFTDTHHRLLWTFHHALLDGRSHFAVLEEVFALYDARGDGSLPELRPRRPYRDYINWLQQQEWSKDFWTESLRGYQPPPALRIGEFLESSLERERRSASESHSLSEELTATLKFIAQKNEITLNTMVQAGWAVLLSRYHGSQDIVFGVTRACRHSTLPESESMVGFLINTLPLRVKLDPQRPLLELLRELRQQQIVLRDYEHTPLAKIQDWSEGGRGKSLFETVLVFENYQLNEQIDRLDGHWQRRHFVLQEQTHYPLTLAAYSGSRLLLKLEYDERRFDASAIQAILGHLATLLEGMATDPNRRLGQLSMLSEAERQRVLFDWNVTSQSQRPEKCLHEIFSEQAKLTPEARAVVFEGEQLTYAELDARANQWARYLKRLGVGPEVLVAICAERSLEMIVGLLGILKAGGAYLPLDPSYPAERLSFMLKDSGASVILTQQAMRDRFASQHLSVVCLDSDWKDVSHQSNHNVPKAQHIAAGAMSPMNLAYVIYTSGSTGEPKGVMVTHENVARLFETTESLFGFDHTDVWTLFHSYAFDFSVWEMWGALLCGGLLVVVPYLISRAPKKFYQLLRAAGVTVLNQTPSAFRQLVGVASDARTDDLRDESSLRLVIFGGEALDTSSVNRWFDQHDDQRPQLVNMYGITETTVHVTHHQLKSGESESSGCGPIGRPLGDLQVYILDPQLGPLPVGVAGEMYVGGAGLSRGYLNRPDLTAERFLPNPFSDTPGQRLYRTGDVARFLRNGDIEYIGRSDRQVKIRGFRIELAEIETCLARHPDVRESAVMLREDRLGFKNLVAYVVMRSGQTTTNELRSFLSGKLPDYMLPAAFVRLEQLPLTENGKLDRNALPPPLDHSVEGEVVAPRNTTEEIVAGIWSEVLAVSCASVQQDFFELGGDSLTATQVILRINQTFRIDLPFGGLFEHRTVAGLASAIEAILVDAGLPTLSAPIHAHDEADRTKPVKDSFLFPASFAQQRLWFLEQFSPSKSVFHLLYAVRFVGLLNLRALVQAVNELARRHESLRTSFVTVDGQPMQSVAREMTLELPVIDLSTRSRQDAEAEARRLAQIEGERPFDLAVSPLLRATLIRIAGEENMLIIAMHHIISDGWSMGVFLRELATLYEAFCAGQPSPLPELPVQYADYSVWQREWMQGEVLATQLAYWKQHLADAPATLEIATDRPRPALQTFAGARHYTEVPASLADRLRAFSRREGVTLFMTLLAAFDVLLWRYSGQDDVVVGTPMAGRTRSELEGLIGLFANTLPLRTSLAANPTFRELLQRVRETSLGAYAHQDIPFDKLVEILQPERSLSHTPFFQVIFALENTPQASNHKGLALTWLDVERGTARTDLSLFMSDKGEELSAIWEYSSDLFDSETISRMMSSFAALLEDILDHPEERIGYLQIWSEAERRQLLTQTHSVELGRTQSVCMHELFERQAELTPAATALVFEDRRLSYQELNQQANQLAHHLRAVGVRPEVAVGVCMERSAELIVALLAVLKAGGAYVPVDPAYPAERLAFMLDDASVPILLTQRRLLSTLSALTAQIVCVDDWDQFSAQSTKNPPNAATPENLAYVIYTSGSTGRPKGVQIRHATVVNLFSATREQLGFRAGDIWTVVHSSAFDFSVWEIWGSLLQGGTLVVVPLDVVQSPTEFYKLLCRDGVTVLNQTPSALRELLRAREQALAANGPTTKADWKVRLIACGGDALDQELAAELAVLEIPVWNFYGPTESTVWTTCGLIQKPAQNSARGQAPLNSIGRPIANLEVYVLDPLLQLVPLGIAGELFIGGGGLARAYLNRPELTAEKFVPSSFSAEPGKRLYRTGDLARYRYDGRIEFLGRLDQQVKLRGFRIELGEIETVLGQHPNVSQAVVTIREDRPGDKRLVAYLTAEGGMPSVGELRKFLQLSLPDYMVPSDFVLLETIPLTPNKKVDRQSLPAPDYSRAGAATEFAEPRDPVEDVLANIWARVLGLENIGVRDNFFERGGHSLLATQVMSRIREAFQVELPLRALFESPTIAGLANKLEAAIQTQQGLHAPPLVPVARDGKLPLSFAQQRLWFLDQLELGGSFYNISRAVRLRGELNIAALSQALDEIVKRHESLRTVFVVDGDPFQSIAAAQTVPLPLIDLTKLSEARRGRESETVTAEEIRKPFDLSRDLLLRACLIKTDQDDHILVLTLHHIAADGWSLSVLFHELGVLYEAFKNEIASPLAPLLIQYADFAVWQRDWLQGEVLERLIGYWKPQLAGAPPVLELPSDKPRPAVQSFRGAYHQLTLPPDLSSSLKQLSRHEGVSLFMTCLAAFQLLLSRYTGLEDFIVGTDVANRNRVETEDLIGFFTNLLPLRAKISGNLTFTELLIRVRETTLEAYAHEDLPFDKLVEELSPPRDSGRNPLVQVLLVMQNNPVPFTLPGLEVSRFELPLESSRFDLVLFLAETENGLAGLWLYDPELFEPGTIARMSTHFERLLASIIKEPSAKLDSYEFLTEDEAKQKQMEKKEREESQVSGLRASRRRGVDLSQLSGVKTEYLQPENALPLVIKPAADDVDLAAWAGTSREFIEKKLLEHGAILFRGFSVDSVPEFEKFAAAICPELFGEYGDLPREELGGKVYGSTPYPADETILFHNESSHMHRWPMLIWFYCVKPAAAGGESPIIDSRKIYQSMEPAIRERFEKEQLMYVRNFTDGLDVSWQQFFHTNDRSAVEQYCRRAGIDFEWTSGNNLRTRQICPAVVTHPQTGEKVFFNQVQLHHISCLAPAVRDSLLSMMKEEDLPRNVYYGDGSPIEDSVVDYLGDLYGKLAVSFPWREHDVLMLNNMLVAHSRNSFIGERKIVVALGNLVSKGELDKEEHSRA